MSKQVGSHRYQHSRSYSRGKGLVNMKGIFGLKENIKGSGIPILEVNSRSIIFLRKPHKVGQFRDIISFDKYS